MLTGNTRDITVRKLAEEHTLMLMAELDHRVKNILAVVSSVVNQSLKSSGSGEPLRAEVAGRIQAIANAHNLLTGYGGTDGSLADLVSTELRPYEKHGRLNISGDDVVLTSRANMSIGLAIHELATNAAKYGALSTGLGHIDLSWRVTGNRDEQSLEIIWIESDGPPVSPPGARGFGTRLIELSLVRGLNAKVNREFLKAGVECRIAVPFNSDVGGLRSSNSLKASPEKSGA